MGSKHIAILWDSIWDLKFNLSYGEKRCEHAHTHTQNTSKWYFFKSMTSLIRLFSGYKKNRYFRQKKEKAPKQTYSV